MDYLKRQRFVSVTNRQSPIPEGTWIKCPACRETIYKSDLKQNQQVCPNCGRHGRISAPERIQSLSDPDSFEERHDNIFTDDPLNFVVAEVKYNYLERVEQAKTKSGLSEAVVVGKCAIESHPTMLGVMDFSFRGGSMGSVLGEKFCRIAADAVQERLPLIMISTSGGARMEEGVVALMQMAKTSDAVRQMNEAGVPYISVLTDPTMGGVYASFASLGDIILAEPGATIGFAGPRLIEGALKVKLPEGFQSAEYQFEHGFVDRIVSRTDMRPELARLLYCLTPEHA